MVIARSARNVPAKPITLPSETKSDRRQLSIGWRIGRRSQRLLGSIGKRMQKKFESITGSGTPQTVRRNEKV